ncbi:glycerophosphodiester phosphodiesterase [Ilyobacter polytropus]|uniref:Glycerophosphoryl diester phosphodiesterase n=1 Tax=Ilyobacter polytropus (strain ATCC 51220 / DSM 2926 / LMG 16218 / CuHBu1) TaxID=572544 RepID=E3H7Q6_ILYPC|nr:glycerophosphodiester phosphodiesterase family protein [Ilyobacter polytropus]ADO82638.1 glycerophosphoryl diester phosphodiesterase [Ilyobacter polytropus DSM 2926]
MKIFGHRGASGYAPQNTISSVRLALDQGSDGVEIDVQLTKDNEVVVCHDWIIDNVSDGKGKVSDFALVEIKKNDFGSYFLEDFKGEKIPTLSEVLEFFPKDIILNIELKIKGKSRDLVAEKVADLLLFHERIENTIVSSFNHSSLKKIKKLIPEIKIAFLYKRCISTINKDISDFGMDIYSIHINAKCANKEIIKEIHNHNKKVYVWNSNDIETTKKLYDMEADGIMTDFPIDMKNALWKYITNKSKN